MQNTFVMLKPDVISKKITGQVIQYFEDAKLKIVSSKLLLLGQKQATLFYQEHKEKPFFKELTNYITSGPVIAQVLQGENVISNARKIIGDTDPKRAKKGTIRGDLAESIEANLVHGSDSEESAKREISIFFSQLEIF